MEAFSKNIAALEQKMEQLVQKWRDVRNKNIALIEHNKQLEKEIEGKKSDIATERPEHLDIQSAPIIRDLSQVQKAIDQQINRIDSCIELINKELDGQR